MMTGEQLTAIAGAILSLAFSYVPGLYERYEPLSESTKRLTMLALLVVAAAAVYSLSCTGWGALMETGVECSKPGLARLGWSLVLAILSNQATFFVTRKVKRET